MVENILILGNGFDLAMERKTSYGRLFKIFEFIYLFYFLVKKFAISSWMLKTMIFF